MLSVVAVVCLLLLALLVLLIFLYLLLLLVLIFLIFLLLLQRGVCLFIAPRLTHLEATNTGIILVVLIFTVWFQVRLSFMVQIMLTSSRIQYYRN
jgi:hypothetical protein